MFGELGNMPEKIEQSSILRVIEAALDGIDTFGTAIEE